MKALTTPTNMQENTINIKKFNSGLTLRELLANGADIFPLSDGCPYNLMLVVNYTKTNHSEIYQHYLSLNEGSKSNT